MMTERSRPINKKSILSSVLLLSIFQSTAMGISPGIAPSFNANNHLYRSDESTGYNVGASLYELKLQEMKVIVKEVVDEVNNMDENELFNFATKNRLYTFSSKDGAEIDLPAVVKTFKVEQAVEKRNNELIEKMNNRPLPVLSAGQARHHVNYITDRQLLDTAISINYSPATDGIKSLREIYDPQGNFGFCFLRAHYYANAAGLRGLVKESIKKVFLVGTMKPMGFIPIGTWQFHVATAVRGEAGVWKTLDNHLKKYQTKASSVKDWYSFYNQWLDTPQDFEVTNASGVNETVKAKALFLFFTDPAKIGASSAAYNQEGFYGNDSDRDGKLEGAEIFYNNIFKDVDAYMKDSKIGFCDSDRYRPLPITEKVCSSSVSKKRIAQRDKILAQWRAKVTEFDKAEEQIDP
ncbi:MAG: hypothetical protein JNM39_15645 [Bdellovibrionaceae bacterium]|nr:hypothetical protein [Pseudobdellovibrionaceae bacterium]